MLSGKSIENYPSMVNIRQFDVWLARMTEKESNATIPKTNQTAPIKSFVHDWAIVKLKHRSPIPIQSLSPDPIASPITVTSPIAPKSATTPNAKTPKANNYQNEDYNNNKKSSSPPSSDDFGGQDDFGNDFDDDDDDDSDNSQLNMKHRSSSSSSSNSSNSSSEEDDYNYFQNDGNTSPSIVSENSFSVVGRRWKRSKKNTVCGLQYIIPEELEGMQLPGRVGGRVVHNPGQLLLTRPPSVQ